MAGRFVGACLAVGLALCLAGCASPGDSSGADAEPGEDAVPGDAATGADPADAGDQGRPDARAAGLDATAPGPDASAVAAMALSSSAFADHGVIPNKYAYDSSCGAGATNTSPPLNFTGVPAGTRSLVLIMEDEDASGTTGYFAHWIAFDIPASKTGLPEGSSATATDYVQALNDFGEPGYGGPCPPALHQYVFHLYAVRDLASLGLSTTATSQEVRTAIQGHVAAEATLHGTFQ